MLIDFHSHLNMYGYRRFGGSVDAPMRQVNRHRILTVSNSLDFASLRANRALAGRSRYVLPVFGIHPWTAPRYVNKLDAVAREIGPNRIVGEIGLDHFFIRDTRHYPSQRKVLELFLAEARSCILTLHTKGAESDVLALLRKYDGNGNVPVIHWYAGSVRTLKALLEMGVHFSIGPAVEFDKDIGNLARATPMDRILTETDNPGGPVICHKGIPMPGLIKRVVRALARAKGRTPAQVEQAVERNFRRLTRGIGLDWPWPGP